MTGRQGGEGKGARGRREAREWLLVVDEGKKGGEGQVGRGDKRKPGEGSWRERDERKGAREN